MSPQVIHSLKQAGIMVFLAILSVMASDQFGVVHILAESGVNPLYFGIATAVIAGLVRWAEGIRDGDRAATGQLVKADVGYDALVEGQPISVKE